MTAIVRRTAPQSALAAGEAGSPFPYINRELSSLEFNRRVLFEAGDDRNPLLERVKFLAIFASNMDEFFQIRVSGLMEQAEAHAVPATPGEKPAAEQLAAIRTRFRELLVEQQRRLRARLLRTRRGRHRHRRLRGRSAAPRRRSGSASSTRSTRS